MIGNLRQIAKNAWDWDLNKFAAMIGKQPNAVWVQEKFLHFQKMAGSINNIPDDILEIISQEKS